jgi:crotonobetainyl-CoA:carnitine CoA-transferase CaiB-like acyl-CoA transferase
MPKSPGPPGKRGESVSGALEGLRVVDFGQYVAGPLVARMLADHGAEVVRIDPPGGPRWRHPANALLQRGKECIELDLADASHNAIARQLVEHADVLIENFRPGVLNRFGLDTNERNSANPGLISCSMPGFASDDPRAGMYAHEGVVSAAAGVYGSRDGREDEAPVFNTLPLASCFAALIAANSIVAALIARARGSGVGQRIEISLFEACFELTRYYGDRVPGAPYPRIRLGATTAMALTQHYACKDGRYVHLSWLEEGRQLDAFARLAGFHAEWSKAGWLDHARVRRDRDFSERLRAVLSEVFRTRSAAEWMALANPDADLAECLTSEEWLLGSEQARATRAVITLDDPELGLTHQAGYPITMSATPPQTRGARRRIDNVQGILQRWERSNSQSTDEPSKEQTKHPLQGIRALDLTQILAGPTACRILAEYGADVIQIANPRARAGRDFHFSTNNGKRSIVLDLKQPAAMDVFWRLLDTADVVSTNFSSEVGARLGVDETSVRRRRPDVIYSRISAYGLDGPFREFRGHDQVGQAVTGMEIRWAGAGTAPLMQPHPLNDFGTGQLAAFGIMLALLHRMRTGEGQLVGASLAQTATFLQVPYMVAYDAKEWSDEPGGQTCRGPSAFERLFLARDRWLFVAARSIEHLLRVMQVAHTNELEATFLQRAAEDWVERLAAADIGAQVVVSPEEAMRDMWAVAHGISRRVEFPDAGAGNIVGPSRRLSRTPTRTPKPVGPIGADGRDVLEEVGLGDQLPQLIATGALTLPSPALVPSSS